MNKIIKVFSIISITLMFINMININISYADYKPYQLPTKEELDSLYLTNTYILEDINKVSKEEGITEERLEYLKEKAIEANSLLDKENFDIFGGMSYDNKLKILAAVILVYTFGKIKSIKRLISLIFFVFNFSAIATITVLILSALL